jgi:hypothetical protein
MCIPLVQCPTPIISNEFLSATNWYARIMIPISSIFILLFLGVQLYQYKFWMTYPRNYLVYNTGTVALSHVAYMVPVFAGGAQLHLLLLSSSTFLSLPLLSLSLIIYNTNSPTLMFFSLSHTLAGCFSD